MRSSQGRFVQVVQSRGIISSKTMMFLEINLVWVSYVLYFYLKVTWGRNLPFIWFQIDASVFLIGAVSYGLLTYVDSKNKGFIFAGNAKKLWQARLPRILYTIGWSCFMAGTGTFGTIIGQAFIS